MLTIKCRYNNKHKFKTDKDLFSHEKYCPDKNKRTDLKACPYTPKHIVLTKQYENHIKKCNYKPKEEPKKEETKVDENNDLAWDCNETQENKDYHQSTDQCIEEYVKNNEALIKNEKNRIIIEKLKSNNNQDVFDDEDFVYKNCYI